MQKINPIKIEKKWQKIWDKKKIYKTDLKSAKKKYYNLVMFPYPSANFLHIGHFYNFGPADTWGRYKRMQGFNVFEPMGFDAFGLPAENFAIKTGVHPAISTKGNIAKMRNQLKAIGTMYDWDKEVVTSSPEYYKWTQWIFLKLYEKGLAYKKKSPVNWCPSCKTVLANEQVQEGFCERCGSEVTKKDLEQWFFNIRKYADKLLNFNGLDWPERTKIMQENWIGRSEGSEIKFAVSDTSEIINVYTTRIDTLFGCTYVVLAPEHPLSLKITSKENLKNVKEYIQKTKKKSDIIRSAENIEKTGVFTGAYAINPVNNEKVPIWIADYVLMTYGTGAVMAVPAHDERDFAFAKKYGLMIKEVIKGSGERAQGTLRSAPRLAFCDDGILINSGKFNDLASNKAREEITHYLKMQSKADFHVNYRLRDWLISRQRYWGAPIPIVYCDKCGAVPVPEKDLPVKLPFDVEFKPKGDGKSPLNTSSKFVNTKCPKCKGKAKREVDTMDTFVCSSWYFLRYVSPKLKTKAFDTKFANSWMPVDMYIGGHEHACMHLLYARFIHKVIHDLGLVKPSEPFKRLVHQGMITKNGAKMSKSKGNVVTPDAFVKQYGSDVFRMYLMFMGPYTDGGDWNDKGISGIARFYERFYRLVTEKETSKKSSPKALTSLHKTIKKVSEDIEVFHFNTAISAFMTFVNETQNENLDLKSKKEIIKLLSPFAPHLAEELWERFKNKKSIFFEKWPVYNAELIKEKEVSIICMVNGKVRAKFMAPNDISENDAIQKALEQENVKKFMEGGQIIKQIYIPGKLVNIVVKKDYLTN